MSQVLIDLEDEAVKREIATLPILSAQYKGDVTTPAIKQFSRVTPGESMIHVAYRRWRRLIDEQWFEVCERWRAFLAFLMDVGPPPSADTILARTDFTAPLRPGNARWIDAALGTKQANAGFAEARRTRRLAPDDPLMTLNEIADRYGVSRAKVNRRRFAKEAGGYTERQVFGLDPMPSNDPKNPPRAPRKPKVPKVAAPPQVARPVRKRDDWIGQLAVEF